MNFSNKIDTKEQSKLLKMYQKIWKPGKPTGAESYSCIQTDFAHMLYMQDFREDNKQKTLYIPTNNNTVLEKVDLPQTF
jgi:general stress protein 26